MNRSQRRLHSYRRRPGVGEVPSTPALVRGATPVADGDRARFTVRSSGFSATISIPSRPAGWVILAGGESELPAPGRDYATVRVDSPPEGNWSDALTWAARWLRSLPEARGLPIAIAGAGEARDAALSATSDLGPRIAALVLDAQASGPIVLTPTLVAGPGDGERLAAFLDAELGGVPPSALNHRRRRVLSRRLERRLRRDCRRRGGALTGRVRAGIATLATALAFTLALGLGVQPAHAAFTADYDSLTGGPVVITGTSNAEGVTLDCDGGPTDDVLFDDGGGPDSLPGPGINGSLSCNEVPDVTVSGLGGADTIDLGAVTAADYSNLDDVVLNGGNGADTVTGSELSDVLSGGGGNDSILGQGGSDTVDYSGSAAAVDVDLGAAGLNATGQGDDTVVAENAIGSDNPTDGDTLAGGSQPASLVGNDGPDTLIASIGNASTLDGGDGADSLDGGAGAFPDSLVGGTGDDILNGRAGNDTIAGGTDDDTLSGEVGNDSLNGEGGVDFVNYGAETSGVTVDLSASIATGASINTDTLAGVEQIDGTPQSDTIEGSSADETLSGGAGNDTIAATGATGGGDDSLSGNQGNDVIDTSLTGDAFGGFGDDTISFVPTTGSGSNQTFDGGTAAETNGDRLVGSVTGDSDRDLLLSDTVLTGQGTDTIVDLEQASLTGDNSDNNLNATGFSGEVTLTGLGGDDTLGSAGGADSLAAGAGTDRLTQTADDNQVLTDTSLTGTGTDSLSGFEQASLSADTSSPLGYEIDATAFTGGPTTLAGGFEDDTLLGSNQADLLDGSTGDDSLVGADGDDVLQPDNADDDGDVAEGDGGTNTIDYSNATGPVDMDLAVGEAVKGTGGGADTDTLTGIQNAIGTDSATGDTLVGDVGANMLDGARGADSLAGAFGDDSLVGGASGDTLDLDDTLQGGAGDNTLEGGDGVNTADYSDDPNAGFGVNANLDTGEASHFLSTDSLSDIRHLTGTSFDDTLAGDGAANDLVGGDGDDIFAGGGETDSLEGGDGIDAASFQDAPSAVEVDLSTQSVSGGAEDSLSEIENATGSAFDDTLTGDDQVNLLGGAGGDDLFRGRGGQDSFDGDTGSNTADFSDAPSAVDVNLEDGSVSGGADDFLNSIQNAIGTDGNDTLTGDGGVNTLVGAGGDDIHNSQDGGVADRNECGGDPGDVANSDVQDTNVGCATESFPPPGSPGGPPPTGGGGGGGGGGGDGGGNGPEDPPQDVRAPLLELSGKKKQKSKSKVKVDATCDEACTVDAGGTIKVPKGNKKKKFNLRDASADIAAGSTATLKLKLKGKAKKLAKKALKQGKKSTAKVKATAADAAGNQSSADRKVKVKKKRKK